MSYDTDVAALTPALYWKLDETAGSTAADSAGSLDGTYQAAPTLGADGPLACHIPGDKAVHLSGTGTGPGDGQYIYRATSPISGTGPFTAHFWLRPDSDSFGRTGRTLQVYWQQRLDEDDENAVRLFVNEDAGAAGTIAFRRGPAALVVSAALHKLRVRRGCWSHLAIRRASGGAVDLLLNGVVVGSGTWTGSVRGAELSVGADHTAIGLGIANQMEFVKGRMAKFALHSAWLSDAALAALVAQGCLACGGWSVGRVRIA